MAASTTVRLRAGRLTRRQVLAGTGAAALVTSSGACRAPGSGGGEAGPAARTQPITLRFMSWRPNAMDRFEKKWQAWGESRKITFDIERLPNASERNTKLTAAIAADQAPDATDSHSDNDFKFYELGVMLQLDKYLSRDKITQERDWGLTYAETWRGKTYALAYWVEPFAVYYNKTMLQKKGIADPWEKRERPGEWTLEEMLDTARRATNPAEDEWGLDWAYGYHDIGSLIWTQGATHYDYDQMKWQLETPASIQAHTWMMEWLKKNRWNVAGPERTRMMEPWGGRSLDNNGMTPFAYGKVAVHYRSVNDWSRMWPVVRDQFDWDMLPVPSIGGKPGASWTAGHPVNAWVKTKYPDDVWEFLKFLIMDDFQEFLAQEQILVPAKKSAQTKFFRAPAQYPYQHAQVFADVFKRPHGIPWRHFQADKNSTVYSEFRDRIYNGELDVVNGLKEASARMNQDVDYGGGEPPFKGLKLPIQPR
jgi:ABC-type glycerol-3-phosphate transport system substrate-binding protein